MRGVARGLVVAFGILAIAGAAWPRVCDSAEDLPPYYRAIRALDGAQFLEDEPIWLCDDALVPLELRSSNVAARERNSIDAHKYRLIGREDAGRSVRSQLFGKMRASPHGASGLRAGDFVSTFELPVRLELGGLLGPIGGLRAGRYEIHRADADTARATARFRVVAPRGSELAVRAAAARAMRLFGRSTPEGFTDAWRLYDAILERYPRTSYRTAILAGQVEMLGRTPDPGAWLTEVFANFHDSCFGVHALDAYMRRNPPDQSVPLLRKLVGLYPDTRLARAASIYL